MEIHTLDSNIFYQLPADISGYWFTEFYQDGTIFGKNMLSKKIDNIASVVDQTVFGTGMPAKTGLGFSLEGPGPASNMMFKMYLIPLYLNTNGKTEKNYTILGYCFETKLPLDFKLSGFGEWNMGKTNWAWNYGEANLEKSLGIISVSYNPALQIVIRQGLRLE